MGFDIGFVHHVQAEAVTQLVERRLVRIVGAAHRVEVVLLHQHQVLAHILHGFKVAGGRVVFVFVDTADQQRFAIQLQLTVLDLHLTKTNVVRFAVDIGAGGRIGQGHGDPVQIGRFGAPLVRIADIQVDDGAVVVAAALIHRCCADGGGGADHLLLATV